MADICHEADSAATQQGTAAEEYHAARGSPRPQQQSFRTDEHSDSSAAAAPVVDTADCRHDIRHSNSSSRETTYVTLFGAAAGRVKAAALITVAKAAISKYGQRSRVLQGMADYILQL